VDGRKSRNRCSFATGITPCYVSFEAERVETSTTASTSRRRLTWSCGTRPWLTARGSFPRAHSFREIETAEVIYGISDWLSQLSKLTARQIH
jgi:hypothetical protein